VSDAGDKVVVGFGAVALTLVVLFCVGSIGAAMLRLTRNYVAPEFWPAAPIITFWQAWAVLILVNLVARPFRSSNSNGGAE
jgi:hypothetical protein